MKSGAATVVTVTTIVGLFWAENKAEQTIFFVAIAPVFYATHCNLT
jgi:hypothetical protein